MLENRARFNILLIFSLAIVAMAPSIGWSAVDESTAATKTVYLIGRDSSGNSVVSKLSAATFESNLSSAFTSIQDSLAPSLLKQNELPMSLPVLELRTIGVGIGLTGLIGLGPIFHVSVNPKVRLIFTNSKNPVYPD